MSFQLSKVLLLVTALSLAMALVTMLPSVWAAFHGQANATPEPTCPQALAQASQYGPLRCTLRMAAGLHTTAEAPRAADLLRAAGEVRADIRIGAGLHEGDQTGVHELPPPPDLVDAQY